MAPHFLRAKPDQPPQFDVRQSGCHQVLHVARRAAEILSHVTQRPQALFFRWGIHHQRAVSIMHAFERYRKSGSINSIIYPNQAFYWLVKIMIAAKLQVILPDEMVKNGNFCSTIYQIRLIYSRVKTIL
jgi:hypothetical protein